MFPVRALVPTAHRHLEDDSDIVRHMPQAEGGEPGDVLMLMLFSLGQHNALESVQEQLLDGERLFGVHG